MQDHQESDVALVTVLAEVGLLGALRREMGKCAAPDLHTGAAAVIWQLAQHQPVRMRDLAADLRVDLSVVSRQVAELEAAGHVQRQPDPTDGRACLLSLTPAGAEALDIVVDRLTTRFRSQLADWDAQELARLGMDLRRLREALLAPQHAGVPA